MTTYAVMNDPCLQKNNSFDLEMLQYSSLTHTRCTNMSFQGLAVKTYCLFPGLWRSVDMEAHTKFTEGHIASFSRLGVALLGSGIASRCVASLCPTSAWLVWAWSVFSCGVAWQDMAFWGVALVVLTSCVIVNLRLCCFRHCSGLDLL
jgi:hypothetical protein